VEIELVMVITVGDAVMWGVKPWDVTDNYLCFNRTSCLLF